MKTKTAYSIIVLLLALFLTSCAIASITDISSRRRAPVGGHPPEGQPPPRQQAPAAALSSGQTVGLAVNDEKAFEGYTLFAPNFSKITYLIDMEGKVVHTWESDYWPGQSAYLLENGNLLRTAHLSDAGGGPSGGGIQEIAWDGTFVWDFQYSNLSELRFAKLAAANTIVMSNVLERVDDYWGGDNGTLPHHDIEALPNGNVLILAWEFRTKAEAIAAGRNPGLIGEGELWPEQIIEIKPSGPTSGEVVWEWHLWDHLIQDYDLDKANYGLVADHPELIDINFAAGGKADWIHANAIDYNPELDQIIINSHSFNEFWVIDHSTTAAESADHSGGKSGMGGDILYRWGNPQSYRAGTASDQMLFKQHDAQWVEPDLPGARNILIFNNGNHRPEGSYSSVDEIVPPVGANGHYILNPGSAYRPEEMTWSYRAENPADFYADKISGAQRLPNGNTLICSGTNGTFFEVTAAGEIVWKYVNPVARTGPLAQGEVIPGDQQGFANAVFRAYRYALDYPGLVGKDLSSGKPIEQY